MTIHITDGRTLSVRLCHMNPATVPTLARRNQLALDGRVIAARPMAKLLGIDAVDAVVARCVRDVEAIDVHTHLLPPTHGNLLLWGIDELLTYHYLVAELFMMV